MVNLRIIDRELNTYGTTNGSITSIPITVDVKLEPLENEFIKDGGYIILDINCSSNGVKNVDMIFNLSDGIKINNDYSGGFLKGITCLREDNCYKCSISNNILDQSHGNMSFEIALQDNKDNKIYLNKMNILMNNSENYAFDPNRSCEFRCQDGLCNLME